MFPTALSITNIEALYDAGVQAGTQTPIFSQDLTNSIKILTGLSPTVDFAASVYGFSPTNGGQWQISKSAGTWTTLTGTGPNGNLAGTAVPINGLTGNLNTTLIIQNATAADVASYRVVITNLWGNSATSQVATLSFLPAPAAGTLAATALAPALGLVAYWPLNETGDPSTGMVEAYDVVGAYNGFYGTNAQDASVNTFISAHAPAYNFSPVVGPESPALAGFPASEGALESLQGVSTLPSTYVSIPVAPIFSTSGLTPPT